MQSNWKSLVKPVAIEKEDVSQSFGRFIAKPLERGFGVTVGNALRRVLLSTLQGASIVGVKVEGVSHGFSVVDGVAEDLTEIVMNLKNVSICQDVDGERVAYIDAIGPKVLTASDIQAGGDVRVLNPDQVICTLADGKRFKADLYIRSGRGYITAESIKETLPLDSIPIDAVFSPVKRVSYYVSDTRVGQNTEYNKLVLEIHTDGSISPEDSLAFSAKILKDQLAVFINFQEMDEESPVADVVAIDARIHENLYKLVDELELSVRAANCLENAGIRYIGELVLRSESEMLKTKNFGRKTLNEIKDLLSEMGLHLGMKVDGLDPTRFGE